MVTGFERMPSVNVITGKIFVPHTSTEEHRDVGSEQILFNSENVRECSGLKENVAQREWHS